MKVLVTGANGLLGQHLVKELLQAGFHVIAAGKGESRLPEHERLSYVKMDLREPFDVYHVFDLHHPDTVIHAGAMTQVDECEVNETRSFETNYGGTSSILVCCEEAKAFLIYISTDFVFDGLSGPYKEEDEPSPVNWYGKTKQMAEDIVMHAQTPWAIIRTVLVYGNSLDGTRSNIITWVKSKLEQGEKIKVVNDQFRTPTYVEDLVKGIILVIRKKAHGIFHISGSDFLTPYQMAIKTAGYFGLNEDLIEEVDASIFSQHARRPPKTGFIIDKARKELGFEPMSFDQGLKKMFALQH
jgi:dTDP-4-dehydrorhamnose reductase